MSERIVWSSSLTTDPEELVRAAEALDGSTFLERFRTPLLHLSAGVSPPLQQTPVTAALHRPRQLGLLCPLVEGRVRIGRVPACDIVIEDDSVSRIHAWLELRSGAWALTDAKSTNGTFVNGVRIRPLVPTLLRSGARIGIAGFVEAVFLEPTDLQGWILASPEQTERTEDAQAPASRTRAPRSGDSTASWRAVRGRAGTSARRPRP